jgi:hypothetical protein
MSVLAVMAARNEAGYIDRTLRSLFEEGIEVVLIDNGSIDGTRELAERHLGAGLLSIEDLPWTGTHDLAASLRAKEVVFAASRHGWHMHVDADEWPRAVDDLPLADALDRVDARFDVVDFDVFEFPPPTGIDMWGDDYRRIATAYYYFRPGNLTWWRAWRNGIRTTLPDGAGHWLPGVRPARVLPERQTMRHYLGLSRSHLVAKRADRAYPEAELARGWHGTRVDMRGTAVSAAGRALMRAADPWDTRTLDRSAPSRFQIWQPGFGVVEDRRRPR